MDAQIMSADALRRICQQGWLAISNFMAESMTLCNRMSITFVCGNAPAGLIVVNQRGNPGTGGRPPPPRRDRERHPRPQVRRRVEPSPLGPLRRQGRLAGRPGDGPQPGPLVSAHRSGRAGGDHQDSPTTLLLYRRTAHPLGATPHFASSPALALGIRVQSRPGSLASPSISCLTAARLPLTRHPAN